MDPDPGGLKHAHPDPPTCSYHPTSSFIKDGAYRAGILQAGRPAQGGDQSPAQPGRGGLCLPILAAQAAGGQEQAAAAAPRGGGGRAGQPQYGGHGAGQDEDARRHPAGQTLAFLNGAIHIL
jgi:hypothetical protein